MRLKKLLSIVMAIVVLAISVGVYNDGVSQEPVLATYLAMPEDNINVPKGRYTVTGENGEEINVIISEQCDGMISVDQIKEIIKENNIKNGESLSINEVSFAPNSSSGNFYDSYDVGQLSGDIVPQWKWYDIKLTISGSYYYGREYVAKDVFIASAARGETYSLTEKFTAGLVFSRELGATYSSVKAQIGAKTSISYSVEKDHKYTGPERSSEYNSTEYRVKFYAKKCYVTQKVKGWPSNHTDTYSATFRCPQRYLSYSIDRIVRN